MKTNVIQFPKFEREVNSNPRKNLGVVLAFIPTLTFRVKNDRNYFPISRADRKQQ